MNCDLAQAEPVDPSRCQILERRDGSLALAYRDDDGAIYIGPLISIPDEDWPWPPPQRGADPPPKLDTPPVQSDAVSLEELLDDPRFARMSQATIRRAELESIVHGLEEARGLADMIAAGAAEPHEIGGLMNLLDILLENARALLASLLPTPEELS